MATRQKSARNGAAASYLRSVKAAQLNGIGYAEISEATGITVDTVKRLMTNRSEFTVDQFLLIAEALGVENGAALSALGEIVTKQDI